MKWRFTASLSIALAVPLMMGCPRPVPNPSVQRSCVNGRSIIVLTVDEGCNLRDAAGNILTDNDYIWACPGDVIIIKSSPLPTIAREHWKRSWRSKLSLTFGKGLFATRTASLSGRTRIRRAFVVTGTPGEEYDLNLGAPCSSSSGSVGTPKIKVGGGG